ncbi:MAG: RecE family exodeoxyribonuclease, partial [Enterobacteriaceae bacterium]|nr:RecE family exodeoxyribonuclease [Enterobacteriaceae bacterium]
TWCDRYGLGEDGRTWQKIVVSAPVKAEPEVKEEITTRTNGQISPKVEEAMQWPVAQMSQRSLIISQFISEESTHHATPEQRKKIADLEMDTDNSYVQNMLWAADKATGFKSLSTHDVWKYTQAIKTVFAQDKRHELNAVITFAQAWVETPHIDRGLLVKEWASGKRITSIQRTDTGTNAGGGNVTDRSADYEHTLDTLDIEIAAATLPMDFDIYNIPGGIYRRAKEIVTCKDSPFKEWSAVLRKTPGVLDYSRAAIFAVVRSAEPHLYMNSASLHAWISSNLTETDHAKPTAETLVAARQFDSAAVVAGVIQGTEPVESLDKLSTEFSVVGKLAAAAVNPADAKPAQPEVANLGGGMLS